MEKLRDSLEWIDYSNYTFRSDRLEKKRIESGGNGMDERTMIGAAGEWDAASFRRRSEEKRLGGSEKTIRNWI